MKMISSSRTKRPTVSSQFCPRNQAVRIPARPRDGQQQRAPPRARWWRARWRAPYRALRVRRNRLDRAEQERVVRVGLNARVERLVAAGRQVKVGLDPAKRVHGCSTRVACRHIYAHARRGIAPGQSTMGPGPWRPRTRQHAPLPVYGSMSTMVAQDSSSAATFSATLLTYVSLACQNRGLLM